MKAQPYRFTICALSTVMVFVCVGLVSNAFSICLPFIIKVHGFSNTQISLLATMKSVTSLLAMFAADRYYGRLGLKKGIALAMLSASLSFFIYGISSTPLLYCAASALSGISYAMGGMIPASLLIRQWFPLKPAAALGIAASGSGIGSVLGPVTLLFLIENFGLSSAFLAQALAVAAVTLPIVALIRENTPAYRDRNSRCGRFPGNRSFFRQLQGLHSRRHTAPQPAQPEGTAPYPVRLFSDWSAWTDRF